MFVARFCDSIDWEMSETTCARRDRKGWGIGARTHMGKSENGGAAGRPGPRGPRRARGGRPRPRCTLGLAALARHTSDPHTETCAEVN